MNALHRYHCPDCNGAGAWVSSPSGCANDPSAIDCVCGRCDGRGTIEAEQAQAWIHGYRPWTPSRRRWTGSRIRDRDLLLTLARCRAQFLAHPLRRDSMAYMTYRDVRRRAMRFVDLPLDDAHLLVSPETAAYFNALVRRSA